LKFQKSKRAAAATLKNRKIAILPYLGRGLTDLTKFGMLMQFDPLDRSDRLKCKNLKIKDGSGLHLEKNRTTDISSSFFERFRQNLAQ